MKQTKNYSSTDIPKEKPKPQNNNNPTAITESKVIKRIKTKEGINQFFDSQIEDDEGKKFSRKISTGNCDMRSLRIKKHMLEEFSKYRKSKDFRK